MSNNEITSTLDELKDQVETPEVEAPTAEVDPTPIQAVQEALANVGKSDEDENESEDSLTFSNGVIEKIVAVAMRDVPGVVGMKGSWFSRVQDAFGGSDMTRGVTVEVTPNNGVIVSVAVLIEYGSYAPQVFEDVKAAVVREVTGMTGLDVAGVNLRIEDVVTPEELPEVKEENGEKPAE